VPLPAGIVPQRITCPRCGEPFVPHTPEAMGIGDWAAEAGTASPEQVPRATAKRWSNRAIGWTVFGGMVVMATVGLIFALATQSERRRRDVPVVPMTLTPISTVAPARLSGLGYLPADSDLVAGFHMAELQVIPTSKDFPDVYRVPQVARFLQDLTHDTGLANNDLDHAVLSMCTKDFVIPRVVLIVQTRRAYDLKQLRTGLNANRQSERHKKTLYHFTPSQSKLPAVVWCAGPQTIVFGLTEDSFDAVPAEPLAGCDHLSASLQELVKKRIEKVAQFWLAADVSSPDKKPALQLLLNSLAKEDRDLLAKVKAFDFWLRFDKELTLGAAFNCLDAEAAERVEQALARLFRDGKLLTRLFGSDPRAETFTKQIAESLKPVRQGNWVTAQGKASVGSGSAPN
jgi:hypothetical protein